jgi:hypothetical protein
MKNKKGFYEIGTSSSQKGGFASKLPQRGLKSRIGLKKKSIIILF